MLKKKPGVRGIQLCAIALSAWSHIRSAWGRQSRVVSIKSGVVLSSLCLPFFLSVWVRKAASSCLVFYCFHLAVLVKTLWTQDGSHVFLD